MLAIMHEVMIHIYRFYNGINITNLNYCIASPKRMGEGSQPVQGLPTEVIYPWRIPLGDRVHASMGGRSTFLQTGRV